MHTSRWRFSLPGIVIIAAVVGAVVWDFRRSGWLAYSFGLCVAGSLFALAIVNRPRFSIGSLGGAGTGACQWFVNCYLDFTGLSICNRSPLTEALAGAIFGALIGLLMVGAVRLVPIIPRSTIKDWMIAIALLAVFLTEFVTIIRSPHEERLVIAGVIVFVGLPCLLVMGLREHRDNLPEMEPDHPTESVKVEP